MKHQVILLAKPWQQTHEADVPVRVVLVAHINTDDRETIIHPREYSTHIQVGKEPESTFLVSGSYHQDLHVALTTFGKRIP